MRLGLTYHNAFDYRHSRQAYDQGFAAWKRVRLTPGEQRSVSTLRLCHIAPPTLDPGIGYHASSNRWLDHLFSGLVEESDDMVVVPDIAQRWQTRDGGRTYIFHLRQDAKWSDGHPVTAADFVLAWRRLLAPGRTDNNLAQLLFDIKGARAYNLGRSSAEEQLGISAPDDFTLAVELEQPASYFLQLLTTMWTRPVPQHLVAEAGDDWAKPERIVTNGPFTITKWSPETRISLARNPHYHGVYGGNVGQVEVSTVIPALEWDLALDLYARGEVDILEIIHATGEVFSSTRLKYGESLVNLENPNTLAIAFNQLILPLDDIRVRRALAMAIDQEGFVRDLRQERAAPALGGWIPHAFPGHSPDLNLAFDPLAARQLLAEAGYPDGRGFPRLEMVWPDIPANREQGDYLAAFWQEMLGVTIVPEYVDFFELMRALDEGDRPPIFMSGWNADYSDPDNFMRNGLHKTGIIEANPRFRVLIQAARSVTDQATRLALYQEADKMLIEEALIVPLTYRFRHFLVHPRVRKLPATLRWRDIIVGAD
jgi:oligopeptide transport system substrate-binding protein